MIHQKARIGAAELSVVTRTEHVAILGQYLLGAGGDGGAAEAGLAIPQAGEGEVPRAALGDARFDGHVRVAGEGEVVEERGVSRVDVAGQERVSADLLDDGGGNGGGVVPDAKVFLAGRVDAAAGLGGVADTGGVARGLA